MRWRNLSLGVSSLTMLVLAACGGGGGGGGGGGDTDWLFPLWVPTDLAIVDVDGDGRDDVLTLAQFAASQSQREGRLIVHLQTSPGSFTVAQTAIVGEYPWKFAVADIDGDGAVDVAVVDAAGSRGVWVLLQDRGNRGRLLAAREVASGVGADDVSLGDLNGDGAPDLAVADRAGNSGRLTLLYQDVAQRGSFLPAVAMPVPGIATTGVAVGDVDGDGRTDLVMTVALVPDNYTPNSVIGISLQQPDGTPGPVATMAPQHGLNVARMTVTDYDGDGRNDVFAYFTPSSTYYQAKLMVLLQGPVPGQLSEPVDTPMQDLKGIDDAVIADLDGDRRPDAAVVGFFPVGSPSVVHARLNRFTQSGAGAFALVSSSDLAVNASRVTAGDVDGDGRNEIVVLGPEDRFVVLD
ncbi:MAG: VCBS repeat-containing protein [Steroidobacteraceae bacterium]|nr:VCBS repeat-containing protein [Steroidobacteraceae bacterium]